MRTIRIIRISRTTAPRRTPNESSKIEKPASTKRKKPASKPKIKLLAWTTLQIKGQRGLESHDVRYGLIEASELIASHIPHTGPGAYRINPVYPDGVQERRYHADTGESEKVRINALRFSPRLVINTNPDGVNGPPVTDKNGVVLGGNSRAMTQQLLYAQGQGGKVRDAIAMACGKKCYGIIGRAVGAFQNPILVRVLVDMDANQDRDAARKLVRRLNESFTQNLDFAGSILAIKSRIPPQGWGDIGYVLAAHMDDGLSAYLSSRRSIELVQVLRGFGVIDAQNASQLLRGHGPRQGLLTRHGRNMVRELLLGEIVKEASSLDYASDATYNILESIAPYIIISGMGSRKWDLRPVLRDVIPAYNHKISSGSLGNIEADLAEVFNQISMFGGDNAGAYDKVRYPAAALVFHVLYQYRRSINQITSRFRKYAEIAAQQRENQGSFLGEAMSPAQALAWAFDAKEDTKSPSGWVL